MKRGIEEERERGREWLKEINLYILLFKKKIHSICCLLYLLGTSVWSQSSNVIGMSLWCTAIETYLFFHVFIQHQFLSIIYYKLIISIEEERIAKSHDHEQPLLSPLYSFNIMIHFTNAVHVSDKKNLPPMTNCKNFLYENIFFVFAFSKKEISRELISLFRN